MTMSISERDLRAHFSERGTTPARTWITAAEIKAAREQQNPDRYCTRSKPLREEDERGVPWLLSGQILDVPFRQEY